jgi:hypothetical protein
MLGVHKYIHTYTYKKIYIYIYLLMPTWSFALVFSTILLLTCCTLESQTPYMPSMFPYLHARNTFLLESVYWKNVTRNLPVTFTGFIAQQLYQLSSLKHSVFLFFFSPLNILSSYWIVNNENFSAKNIEVLLLNVFILMFHTDLVSLKGIQFFQFTRYITCQVETGWCCSCNFYVFMDANISFIKTVETVVFSL